MIRVGRTWVCPLLPASPLVSCAALLLACLDHPNLAGIARRWLVSLTLFGPSVSLRLYFCWQGYFKHWVISTCIILELRVCFIALASWKSLLSLAFYDPEFFFFTFCCWFFFFLLRTGDTASGCCQLLRHGIRQSVHAERDGGGTD